MKILLSFVPVFCLLLYSTVVLAQRPVIRPMPIPRGNTDNRGNRPLSREQNGQVRPGGDSAVREGVERRDYSDDSLRVNVYSFQSVRPVQLDTSIRDYTTRFPIPGTHLYLGNTGSATCSYLFQTPPRTGWDPGFHAFDAYKFSLQNLRFYSTPDLTQNWDTWWPRVLNK